MRKKTAFTLIEVMIVLAVIAVLAMVAVSTYTRYIERAKESVVQSLLQNLAIAQLTLKVNPAEGESFIAVTGSGTDALNNILRLGEYGFRPDPAAGFAAIEHISSEGDFILFAAHMTVGSPVFVYDFIPRAGVHSFDPSAAYAALLPANLFIYVWQPSGPPRAAGRLTIDASTGRVTAYNPI